MQFSGSFLQSVLHLNRSQDIQPIGGVSARPLSRQSADFTRQLKARNARIMLNLKLSMMF